MIENTLNERGGKYGDFTDEAVMAQTLLDTLMAGDSWRFLTSVQRQALQMLCVKQARIVCGDPNYTDNWLDIEGYARLARERCHAYDPRQGALDLAGDGVERSTDGIVPQDTPLMRAVCGVDPDTGRLSFFAPANVGHPVPVYAEPEPEVREGFLRDGYRSLADKLTAQAKADMAGGAGRSSRAEVRFGGGRMDGKTAGQSPA